ncbi:MAG: GNAT family N-acetyltransferase [Acidimicrobiales bacterium]
MPHPYWPLFDLVVRTPLIELRYPDDDFVTRLATLAAKGIHDPTTTPWVDPWTDAPSPLLERDLCRLLWRKRAEWSPVRWNLSLAVLVDGELVGLQGINAWKYPVRRVVRTMSWLGLDYQGQGFGKEMRAAVLHLAFAGLGARLAESEAWHDNEQSLRVTKAAGYQTNGWRIDVRRGRAAAMLNFLLDRAEWEKRRRADIDIAGLEPSLALFGLHRHDNSAD